MLHVVVFVFPCSSIRSPSPPPHTHPTPFCCPLTSVSPSEIFIFAGTALFHSVRSFYFFIVIRTVQGRTAERRKNKKVIGNGLERNWLSDYLMRQLQTSNRMKQAQFPIGGKLRGAATSGVKSRSRPGLSTRSETALSQSVTGITRRKSFTGPQ